MKKLKEQKRYFLSLTIIDLAISILCFFTFFRFQSGTFFYLFELIVALLALLVSIFYAFLFLLASRNIPPPA